MDQHTSREVEDNWNNTVIELAEKKSLDVFTKQTALVSKAFVEMGKQLKPNFFFIDKHRKEFQ